MMHDHSQLESEPKPFWSSRYSFGLMVLGAVAAYFLLTEHRAHLFAALPLLLLFGCLGMHVFMHHGHGGHGGGGGGGHGHEHGGSGDPEASARPLDPRTGNGP